MTIAQILKAKEFSEVSESRLDEKKRIALGKIKSRAKYYKIYVNLAGQIILDPQVTVPASELWLLKNKSALHSVLRGLSESAEGKLVKKPSLAKHANDEIE
jgi:hypothetical protein